ncbi:hypothetical protein [Brevibacillus massiliensis]|uniref:hypothetical protein n=1 Tax=Brevibacillus massiliensis TaxID=1118054 RepID=UPI00031A6D9D|nr:hypothetical protein [Brevibacillus massiliensis]
MKPKDAEVLYQAESAYGDLLLRKNFKMRIIEVLVFIFCILLASIFIDSQSVQFKVIAIGIAIAVVGLAPFAYKAVLRPRYTLTRTHLIISMGNKETAYPLSEVEEAIEGRHFYKINGKRYSLMVSRDFLAKLNEQLLRFKRKNKRR